MEYIVKEIGVEKAVQHELGFPSSKLSLNTIRMQARLGASETRRTSSLESLARNLPNDRTLNDRLHVICAPYYRSNEYIMEWRKLESVSLFCSLCSLTGFTKRYVQRVGIGSLCSLTEFTKGYVQRAGIGSFCSLCSSIQFIKEYV